MRPSFVVSLPERLVRSLVGGVAGLIHESAQVLLPRFVRRSRLYEASAKNLLRLSIELVGGVESTSTPALSAPYARAVQGHFDPERETWTERGIEKVSRLLRRGA